MRNAGIFRNKKITIVGFARSGVACADLLFDLGANVSITDNSDNAATRENLTRLNSKEINIQLGKHTQDFIKGRDIIVVSPGVSIAAQPVLWAKQLGIPVVSEIEIAWLLCSGSVIAVTGSNGKTTVTTLVGKVIEECGSRAFVCGNIGNPFSGEIKKIKENDYVSLEISSFQLESVDSFKPKISVILNFAKNHLDRHKDMQEYLDAKKRIFMNQDASDYLVINGDDPILREVAKEAKSKVVYFKSSDGLNPNQAAVMTVAGILGIDETCVKKVFSEFKGIEHRMEYVAEINEVKFINDSKATTVDSAIWALENINSPVILIAGGKDKGVDYSIILKLASKKVRDVILIGEARQKIASVFQGKLPFSEAQTLEEAVDRAYMMAKPGDCVLLSPMCASFDMFKSYEERGKVFKSSVERLNKEWLGI